MALLTLDERKAIFKALGLGEYNKKNIKAFQKKYMLREKDADGIYGENTDNTLRTVYYTKIYTKNFKPEEFRCECGGKYCCGYPSYMKPAQLMHIQRIRDHYGKPITITSGLRCKTWNKKCGGSIQNSLHMSGQALDFYQSGVTDTLKNRKASIKWIKTQPNHHYSYGNGINSKGVIVSAPYMGNALHTDTYDNVKPTHPKWDGNASKTTTTKPTQTAPSTKAQEIVDYAKKYAWAKGTKASVYKYPNGHAKSVYKTALRKYCKRKAKISQTDCGYYVNTSVLSTGIKKFDSLPDKASQPYPKLASGMKIVHKGKKIPKNFLKPGDVIRYKKKNGHQHTLIYLGKIGKFKCIADAGRRHWFPLIKKDTKKYNNAKSVKLTTLQVLRAK